MSDSIGWYELYYEAISFVLVVPRVALQTYLVFFDTMTTGDCYLCL